MIRRMSTKGSDIARQLRSVLDRVSAASQRRPEHLQAGDARLVAVSKTKPAAVIVEAYSCGQRHFGENYVQELVDKGSDQEILQNCGDVKWHFIGHLQRNKVNRVTSVPGLYMVETVDSQKLAQALNNSWSKQSPAQPLAVLAQINTSREENKSGADPSQAVDLALYIRDKCPQLRLAGLMTIGSVVSSTAGHSNPDFECLRECRKVVAEALGVAELVLELSMGMSQDFEHAVESGSTNVRVGSTIFGARQYDRPRQTESLPSPPTSTPPLATAGSGGDADSCCVAKDNADAAAGQLSALSLSS